jgi:hypothetical protein
VAYTGPGALAGLAVLGTGGVLLAVEVARTRRTPRGSPRRARLSPRLQEPKEVT